MCSEFNRKRILYADKQQDAPTDGFASQVVMLPGSSLTADPRPEALAPLNVDSATLKATLPGAASSGSVPDGSYQDQTSKHSNTPGTRSSGMGFGFVETQLKQAN